MTEQNDKKRSLADADEEGCAAKEARIVRGLTALATRVPASSLESGDCSVCGKTSDKCVPCRLCKETMCTEHAVRVRDVELCDECCAKAALCGRCKVVTIPEDGAELCASCTGDRDGATAAKEGKTTVRSLAHPMTENEFSELVEDEDDEDNKDCEICDYEGVAVVCRSCEHVHCREHMYVVLEKAVCTSCLPAEELCVACGNDLAFGENSRCDPCDRIDFISRTKHQCDECKEEVEQRDAEYGGGSLTCFECIRKKNED